MSGGIPAVAAAAGVERAVFWRADPAGGYSTLPVDVGAALSDALTRYLNGVPKPLRGDVPASVVIAADTPCIFTIEQAIVSYHLLRNALPSGAPKQVFRFADARATCQTLSITLPGGAAIASARVEVVPSLSPGGLAGGGNGQATDTDLDITSGMSISSEHWVGRRFPGWPEAQTLGMAIGLMALASNTQVLLEIQEDCAGQPSGKKLAAGTVAVPLAGERAWITVRFTPAPVQLPQTCWLLLTAAQGQAVWLANPASGEDIQVLDRSGPTAAWTNSGAVLNLRGLQAPLVGGAQAGQPLGLSLAGQPIALTTVQPGATGQGNALRADFAAALQAYLATQPRGQDTMVPLVFTSSVGGLITVYAPRIEYDI
jgi:hypothetical protein